jgi:hypothetical protein
LIVAGRLSDANKFARKIGTPNRAGLWSGGTPYEYK